MADGRVLGHKIGIHFSKNRDINYNDMEYYVNDVKRKYEQPKKDNSDDFDISKLLILKKIFVTKIVLNLHK